jgi:hypothetical protein
MTNSHSVFRSTRIARGATVSGCLAAAAIAVVTGTSAITLAASPAAAQGCPWLVTHWGRMAYSPREARYNAHAGMRWKIENRLADTLRMVRGIRLEQCKRRDGGNWQCQTSAVVDTCL